jgi:membrane peptidoglycan carboxypeptidase
MNPVRRKRRRWKRVLAYLALVLLCLMLGGMTFVGVLYYQVAQMMPSVNVLEGYKPREASEIYSADGVLLARIAEEYREPVPLSQIPQHLINATIAKEDRRFWSPSRRGLARHRASRVGEPRARRNSAGGQHTHPAAGAQRVPHPTTHFQPQTAGDYLGTGVGAPP